uniref:3-hydroxyacyl-CoA dehydrogenase n=1 Tax=Thermorudis peleae TaxID=1382356 RepID=A0A831TJS5_9BACT
MIRRIGIVGAGSMGGAIAGLAASAGLEVLLLDVRGEDDPSAPARRGLERAIASRAFLDPEAVRRVTVGNIDDHLALLAECDWILEAIVEDRELKRDLFRALVSIAREDAIITTNTSTFTLGSLLPRDAMAVRDRFFATHFFNPPRALLLVEVACLPEADQRRFDRFVRFLERRLGRRALVVRDTPGFVANRFGIYALVLAIRYTGEFGLALEEVDALTGPLLGRPRSATFRTVDLTGLDILVLGTGSLRASTGDDYTLPSWVERLYAAGHLGDKTGGGFFRREGEQHLALDASSGDYRPYRDPSIPGLAELLGQPFPQRLRGAIELPDPYGAYVRALLGGTYRYVLERTPEVAPDLPTVDRALEWGFGWAAGPYRQMDALGLDLVRELVTIAGGDEPELLSRARRRGGFYSTDGVLDIASDAVVPLSSLPTARRTNQTNAWSALDRHGMHEVADGVVALLVREIGEFPAMVEAATRQAGLQALVVVPRLDSLGYPYEQLLRHAESGEWQALDELLARVQGAFTAIAGLGVPLVVVLDGAARGAATTLALWADRTVAYVTTTFGFPEVAAGLLPFGTITGVLARRTGDDVLFDENATLEPEVRSGTVEPAMASWPTLAKSASIDSAPRARRLGFLTLGDVITLDRDGMLEIAGTMASTLAGSILARNSSLPKLAPVLRDRLTAETVELAERASLPSHLAEVWHQLMAQLGGGAAIADALAREREALARLLRASEARERLRTVLQQASAGRR